ncbi:hypothetical protein GCM10025751_03680 [Haladaptatus pallidirubidus]|uniref:Uncharacterized protein n=2 Tax=Haladaptatus pallidirubidus TaxID=1008152 RepID=A0AAV3UBJ8_9EURY
MTRGETVRERYRISYPMADNVHEQFDSLSANAGSMPMTMPSDE